MLSLPSTILREEARRFTLRRHYGQVTAIPGMLIEVGGVQPSPRYHRQGKREQADLAGGYRGLAEIFAA